MKIPDDLKIERPSFEVMFIWRCRICGDEEGYVMYEKINVKLPQGWSWVAGMVICPKHLDKIMEVLAKEKLCGQRPGRITLGFAKNDGSET